MNAYSYEVIEDNGGGLHLFVFDNDKPIFAFSDFEYQDPAALVNCINGLEQGDDPADWEGHNENPAKFLKEIKSYEFGWEIVCEGPPRKIYPDRMGAAAMIAFDVDPD